MNDVFINYKIKEVELILHVFYINLIIAAKGYHLTATTGTYLTAIGGILLSATSGILWPLLSLVKKMTFIIYITII